MSETGAPLVCDALTPIVENEVTGVATDATIYGLLFPTEPLPIRSGDELKIVWRMTGVGDLSVSYESPDGSPATLTFGPEPHSGSSYDRPGDEWGTGFNVRRTRLLAHPPRTNRRIGRRVDRRRRQVGPGITDARTGGG